MANAADNYEFNNDNVFDNWDLNPLAMKVGAGADGVRDTLAAKRDAFLQPKMAEYRNTVGTGSGKAAADDQGLFGDAGFQDYVKTGQVGQAPAQSQSVTQQWTSGGAAPAAVTAPTNPQRSALYDTLMKRATQSLTVDPNDPNIRTQTDAFNAQQERDKRRYLSQAAEAAGPGANMLGETRLANEHAGQAKSGFVASLVGQELKARRDEIAQAIQQMQQSGQFDDAQAMQAQLANLDAAIKQQGMSLQGKSIDNDMTKALLNNDATMRELGLNEWDRTNYWDALKSGYLG